MDPEGRSAPLTTPRRRPTLGFGTPAPIHSAVLPSRVPPTPVFSGPVDGNSFFTPSRTQPNRRNLTSRGLFATPAAAHRPADSDSQGGYVPRMNQTHDRLNSSDFNNLHQRNSAQTPKAANLSPQWLEGLSPMDSYPTKPQTHANNYPTPPRSNNGRTSGSVSLASVASSQSGLRPRSSRERSIFYSMLFLVVVVFCLHPKVYKYIDMYGRYVLGIPSYEDTLTEEYCSYHLSPACIKFLNNRKYYNLTDTVNKEISDQTTKIELELHNVEDEITYLLHAMRREAAFKQDIMSQEEIIKQIREVTTKETSSILQGYIPELQLMIRKQFSLTLDLVKKKMDALRYEDQLRYSETFESFADSLFRELVYQLEALKNSKIKWIEESLVDIEHVILQDIREQIDNQVEESIHSQGTSDIITEYSNALVDVKMIEAQISVAYTLRQTIAETNSLTDEARLNLSKNITELEELAYETKRLLSFAEDFVNNEELDDAIRSAADKIDLDSDETVVKNPVFLPQPVVMFQAVSLHSQNTAPKSDPEPAAVAQETTFEHSFLRTRAEYKEDPYFNYAGSIHGATIMKYSRKRHNFLGLSLWGSVSKLNAVENILIPSLQPGDCWVTPGPKADVVIRLADSVAVGRVALSHTSSTIRSESVPKEFQLIGLTEDGHEHDLGTFTFVNTSSIRQEFRVHNPDKKLFRRVLLRFHTNYGSASHSCIYYVEVLNH